MVFISYLIMKCKVEETMGKELDRLKQKLASGKPALGSVVFVNDISVIEIMGANGCDWLWIDAEHSWKAKPDIFAALVAARAAGIPAFVRIAWNDPVLAKPILDMGADGLIFPFINSAKEAEAAIKSMMYPPKGVRGFAAIRPLGYGTIPLNDYLDTVDQNTFHIVQVEHAEAVKNIDEICRVDGIDCLMFGPMDLTASYGVLGQINHPSVVAAIDKVCEAAYKHNIPLGISTGYSREHMDLWLKRGIKLFAAGADLTILSGALANIAKDFDDACKAL